MKKTIFMFAVVLLVGSYSCVKSSDMVDQAEACFGNYVKALKSGDEQKAKQYWNEKEKKRYKIYDWQLKDLIFRNVDVKRLHYKMREVQEKDAHVTVLVDWYDPEDSLNFVQRDLRYFVRENDKMVGANPILVFTKDWLEEESKHFTYHFKAKEGKPDKELLDRMDDFCERTVNFLEIDYQDKIDYFRCDSAEEVGRFFNLEPSLARCDMINGVVAAVRNFVPHEVVHIISYRILEQDEKELPPVYLNEGLAYFLGGATFFTSDLMLSWAKRRIAEDETVTLTTLIDDPFNYGSNDGPGLMSSLVKFLIEIYGLPKFKQIYGSRTDLKQEKQNLEEVYQKKVEQLEKEWKNFILTSSLPEIEAGVSLKGKEVFQVSDPAGDDKGDGEYVYPENEKAIPGMFDLIDFKMAKDDELIYFQLEFSDLTHSETESDRGFNGTFAAIVVDADGVERSGNRRLFYDNGNFLLSEEDAYEFVVEVSHAGILVYDHNWVWQLLFLRAFSERSHIQENKFVFAIPQKTIGSPHSDWKIQVISGGLWGGYKNTAYGAGRFMRVGESVKEDEGGGGTDTDFNPDVYDILAPEGKNQTQILSGYDTEKEKKVTIPMIGCGRR